MNYEAYQASLNETVKRFNSKQKEERNFILSGFDKTKKYRITHIMKDGKVPQMHKTDLDFCNFDHTHNIGEGKAIAHRNGKTYFLYVKEV